MKNIECCPICASPKIKFYYKGLSERVPGNYFDLSICEPCQHYFLNPQPDWVELETYYNAGYSPYSYHLEDGTADKEIEIAKDTSIHRHVRIDSGMTVLDVGCGGGDFLYVVKGLGAVTQGVEPSIHGVKTTKKMGIDVFHGNLTSYIEQNGTAKKFDLITANHVLEHHPDPKIMLTEMSKLLSPGGMMWLSVPNAGYFYAKYLQNKWHSLDIPYHLMHFNSKSLAILVENADLKLQRLYTHSFESAFLATYKTYLRKKFFIPIRLTDRLPLLINPLARREGQRLDANCAGEALVMEVVLP